MKTPLVGAFNQAIPLLRARPQAEAVEGPVDSLTTSVEPKLFRLKGVAAPVRGHLLDDPDHLSYPSTRYEIRAMGRAEGGQVAVFDFPDLLPKGVGDQISLPCKVSNLQIYEQNTRLQEQTDPAPERPRVLPKDHGIRVHSMEMSVGEQDASDRYFEQLTEIGAVEGFLLVGIASSGKAQAVEESLRDKQYTNFALVESEFNHAWLEDYGEPTERGGRLVPASVFERRQWISQAQQEGRQERLAGTGLSPSFSEQGAVAEKHLESVAVAQGLLQGQNVHQAQSYLEGGNILPGSRADGTPYLLVGQDSLAITKKLLSTKLARPVSHEEVLATIAKDTGLESAQVFAIEQPGEFHIDMRLMPIGPGEFVLQDSRVAADMQIAWLRQAAGPNPSPEQLDTLNGQITTLRDWGERMTPYEDRTAEDIRKAGMVVHRIAGAFVDPAGECPDQVNFFNGRHGTNAQGERYSILMGAPPQLEAHIARTLLVDLKAPVDRLYFVDPSETAETLSLHGGLKCRSKCVGDIVTPPQKPTSSPAQPHPGHQYSLFPGRRESSAEVANKHA